MAKYSIEIQDHEGNIYYPHSESATTFFDDGENLDTKVTNINNDISTKAPKDVATTSANGLMSKEDKAKLNGIEAKANNYVHPDSASVRHVTDTEKAKWNAKAETTVASTTANGLMSSADKTKLDGIATGANKYVHPNDINTRHVTDAEKNTWNAKASTSLATTSANGLMSSADKTKLDGIATGANKYVHPSDSNTRHVTDAEKTTWNGKASTSVATTLANGLMSKEDKVKLDGIEVNANNYVHPNSATIRHVSDTEKATWNSKANQSDLDALKDQIVGNKPIVITDDTPVGTIAFVSSDATNIDGWLECNGVLVPKASYPDLFAIIEYTHGGGGANFGLPNIPMQHLIVSTVGDDLSTIDDRIVMYQKAIIKAKKLDKGMTTVAQEWTNFKNNGGEIGGPITTSGGILGPSSCSYGFGGGNLQLKNGQARIDFISGDGIKPPRLEPLTGGDYDLGDPAYYFKNVWIGPYSKNPNGHTKLPNGMIYQWGQIDVTMNQANNGAITATFPTAFTTSIRSFGAICSGNSFGWGNSDIIVGNAGCSNNDIRWACSTRNGNNVTGTAQVTWWALGY